MAKLLLCGQVLSLKAYMILNHIEMTFQIEVYFSRRSCQTMKGILRLQSGSSYIMTFVLLLEWPNFLRETDKLSLEDHNKWLRTAKVHYFELEVIEGILLRWYGSLLPSDLVLEKKKIECLIINNKVLVKKPEFQVVSNL